MLSLAILLLLSTVAIPGSGYAQEAAEAPKPKAPAWSREEMKTLLASIQTAARSGSVQAQDQALVQVGAAAYRVKPDPGEGTDALAKRILRKRDPDHPSVKGGQWLAALMRRFYLDASSRCRLLSRFETSRQDRRFFEQMQKETQAYAQQIAANLKLVVEGLEDQVEPLPAVDGDPPTKLGVLIQVHSGGKVNVQKLDRVTFQEHQPPPDHPRTSKGALREIRNSIRQYQQWVTSVAPYDRKWGKNRGHAQAVIPTGYPAIYLNEVAKGAKEAGIHTLHLLTMSKRGELREIPLVLNKKKAFKKKKRRRKKKRKKVTTFDVRCTNIEPMSKCARRIRHGHLQGQVVFKTDVAP